MPNKKKSIGGMGQEIRQCMLRGQELLKTSLDPKVKTYIAFVLDTLVRIDQLL
ncbi:MAG: hypothetical protein QY317_16620 [Candidatus Jettenia caeni]|nr:MAG: hypothetical protein QY317_16620 [Candidatus Jettenia caeni]